MSVIEEANEKASIIDVCALFGLDVSGITDGRASTKFNCPFGNVYHSDGGIEKAFRVYPDTNSAFCFAGCGYYSPVSLASRKWDISHFEAAKRLLETATPEVDAQDRWAELTKPKVVPIDKAFLKKALEFYVNRIAPGRFDEDGVQVVWRRLVDVMKYVKTDEDAEQWFTVGKQALRIVLGVEDDDPQT